jgi:hypothetical protein
MALSNSFSFTDSTSSIINDAAAFTGKLALGDTLEPEEYNLALRELNRMSKSLMLKNDRSPGMKMWLRHEGFLFLNANTGQYNLSANANASPGWTDDFTVANTVGPNPPGQNVVHCVSTAGIATNNNIGLVLDNNTLEWTTVANVINSTAVMVETNLSFSMNNQSIAYCYATNAQPPQVIDFVNLRDNNGNDLYIDILTYEEFTSLPAKQSQVYQGDPVAVYYESHLVGSNPFGFLNTDVNGAIDLTKYLVVNYVREIQDWVNPTDQPDFPKEWNSALVYGLARRLSVHWNTTWTKLQEQLAGEALNLAQNANPKKLAMHFSRSRRGGAYRNNPPHR